MQNDLKNFVQENPKLVSMKEASPGLFVLKYKKKVFFDNLWNDHLEECRGTIVDKDFNVVSRPFTKIYNYGIESRSPKLSDDTLVTAYRKINGFMVAVTWHQGDVLVSTTGSIDSPYVALAKEMMLKHLCWEDWQLEVCAVQGVTLMFECVHPDDPHIVPEKPGMYFLGWRENTWNGVVSGFGVDVANNWDEYGRQVLKCHSTESFVIPLSELIEKSKEVKHEGFVFYTKDNVSAKIKSPFYLVNKFVSRNPRTDKLMDAHVKEKIDEEYYPLVDKIQAEIESFTAKSEQERLAWVRNFLKAQ